MDCGEFYKFIFILSVLILIFCWLMLSSNSSSSSKDNSLVDRFINRTRVVHHHHKSNIIPTCSENIELIDRVQCFSSAIEYSIKHFDKNVKEGKVKLIEPFSEF